jgi:1-acyl-sn-glycerol-3-phosphate acyltransferase
MLDFAQAGAALAAFAHNPLIVLPVLGLLVGALSYFKVRSLRPRIKDVTTCGYIAPSPAPKYVRSLNRLARFFLGIQVGKIRFQGLENFENLPGPAIYSANHPHYIDPLVASRAVPRPARYMAHGRVMQSLGGLLGLFLSKRGVFTAHDNIKDHGARTRTGCVQMLENGELLVVFPEGLTNFSPQVDALKPGVCQIVKEYSQKTGKAAYVIPGYTRYGRYPGKWLAKLDRPIQYFLVLFGFPLFRRGAVTTVGRPISSYEFYGPTLTERSDDEAMAILHERIQALDPGHM